MAKPTLFQALLNRPSQSYSFPKSSKKEYHSTKPLLVQIASAKIPDDIAAPPHGDLDDAVQSFHVSATTVVVPRSSTLEVELHNSDPTSRYPKLEVCYLRYTNLK